MAKLKANRHIRGEMMKVGPCQGLGDGMRISGQEDGNLAGTRSTEMKEKDEESEVKGQSRIVKTRHGGTHL